MHNNENKTPPERIEFVARSEEETERAGARLAKTVQAGAFVALHGALGAGKTAFARGFAAALGDDGASSPTFSLAHEYDTQPPVFHFDVYRLEGAADLEAIGFDDYLQRDGIVLMEWPERVAESLPDERFDVYIERIDEWTRRIAIETRGHFRGNGKENGV